MLHIVILSSLCKWKREKWLFLFLNGTQYARLLNGGTQYSMPTLGGTQYARGRVCHPHIDWFNLFGS